MEERTELNAGSLLKQRVSLVVLYSVTFFSWLSIHLAQVPKAPLCSVISGSLIFLSLCTIPDSTISIEIFNEAFDSLLPTMVSTKESLWLVGAPGPQCEVRVRFPLCQGLLPAPRKLGVEDSKFLLSLF